MRNLYLTLLAICFLTQVVSAQHQAVFFGVNAKNDECHKLIKTSDNHFLFVGRVDNDAALYKYDCGGKIVDSLRKDLTYPSSFESFFDAVELPSGEFLAIGSARVLSPARNLVLAMRVSANLQEVAFDTFLINGREANALQITQIGSQYYISGYVGTAAFADIDGFWTSINSSTLAPGNNITTFSYGAGYCEIQSAESTADGGVLLSGVSYEGAYFFPEAVLKNRAFVRKMKPDGALTWEYVRIQNLKNKFGRVTFNAAHENPVTGNIVATGTYFTGDTLTNTLDPSIVLISPSGVLLDSAQIIKPGQQRLHVTLPFVIPGIYITSGDSTSLTETNSAGILSIVFGENNQKIVVVSADSDPLPISVRGLANVEDQRIAFAGIFYDPSETAPATNQDVFVALPALIVAIDYIDCVLESQIGTDIPMPMYQWFRDDVPISGADEMEYTPTQSGVYYVQVTDSEGCQGTSVSETVTVAAPVAQFTFVENNLTITFTNTSTNAAYYIWDFGDGTTSTAINPVHTYASAGLYTVKLIANDVCGLLTSTQSATVGVVATNNPTWLKQFELSPNPNSGIFNITLDGVPQPDISLTLFGLQGQILQTTVIGFASGHIQYGFDLAHLPSGIYLLRISAREGIKYVKVSVN